MRDTESQTPGDEAELLLALATGDCPPGLANRLLLEVVDALGLAGGPADGTAEAEDGGAADARRAEAIAATLQAMAAAGPRDALGAMLAAQMAAVHGAAMRALRRAGECGDFPQIEALYLREAARLLNLFQRQTETLERRARAGQPRDAAEAADAAGVDAETADAPRTTPSPKPSPARGEGLRARGERLRARGEGLSGAAPEEPSPLAGEGRVRGTRRGRDAKPAPNGAAPNGHAPNGAGKLH